MTTTTNDKNNNENAPNHEVKTDYNNKNDKTTTMTMHQTKKCKLLKPTTKW